MRNKRIYILLIVFFMALAAGLVVYSVCNMRAASEFVFPSEQEAASIRSGGELAFVQPSEFETMRLENALLDAKEIGDMVANIQNSVISEDDADKVSALTEPLLYHFTGWHLTEDWFYAPGGGVRWEFYVNPGSGFSSVLPLWTLWSDAGDLVALVRGKYDVYSGSFGDMSIHITAHAQDFWEPEVFYNDLDRKPD